MTNNTNKEQTPLKTKVEATKEVAPPMPPKGEQCESGAENDMPFDGPYTKIGAEQQGEQNSKLSVKMEKMVEKQEKQLSNPKPKEKRQIYIRKDASELMVISRARDLVRYVINATRKIPKSERYSFAVKVQGLALDMMECMVRANLIVLKAKKLDRYRKRYEFQEKAMGDLKVLEYLVAIAVEENIMLLKQFQQIAKQGAEVSILLSKWIESDKRRFLAFSQ